MAWERNFEKKILKIREKELKYQKLNYTIEVCPIAVPKIFSHHGLHRLFGMPSGNISVQLYPSIDNGDARRNGSPILVTLVSFWHFAVIRRQVLTPSIAFTSVCSHIPSSPSY